MLAVLLLSGGLSYAYFVATIANKDSGEVTTITSGTMRINYVEGNKVDLERKREVSYKEGEEFSISVNAIFQETTSKEHEKITILIDDLIRKYIEYYKGENDEFMAEDAACCNVIIITTINIHIKLIFFFI